MPTLVYLADLWWQSLILLLFVVIKDAYVVALVFVTIVVAAYGIDGGL